MEGADGPLPRRHRAHPADAAVRLRADLPRDGRQARHDPADGPADARVPPRPRRAARRGDAPAHHRTPTRQELREKEALLAAVNAMREHEPDARPARRAGSASSTRRSARCRCRRSSAPRIKLKREGVEVLPEIMIPLVGFETELTHAARARSSRRRSARWTIAGRQVAYQFGTMIELPRAALTAGEIAKTAEFFSFGTNDLTQTTLGCQPRRRRGQVPREVHRDGHPRRQPVRVDRPGRRRRADAAGGRRRPRDARRTSSSASAASTAASPQSWSSSTASASTT